jgi:nucleotide-binding universal stress UspA family protein
MHTDEALFEALRDAVRRICAVDVRCRVACITVVPPAASLTDDTETGRHIKHLVNLRRWAKPLELPEERLTYHVLESEKPAAALIDYASMNDVDQILIGAPRSAAHRWFAGVSAQVVGEAPCSVTVVRPRRDG